MALDLAKHDHGLDWERFKREAEIRFASKRRALEAMSRLFATESCKGKEEYAALIRDVEILRRVAE